MGLGFRGGSVEKIWTKRFLKTDISTYPPGQPQNVDNALMDSMGASILEWLSRSWVLITLTYIGSRLVSTALLIYFMAQPGQIGYEGSAVDNFFTYSSSWDGGWYQKIAQSGYPLTLDLDAAGHLVENAWAFLPVYPVVVNTVTLVTGVPWSASAVAVSLLCGWGTAQLLFKVLDGRIPRQQAFFATVLFCFSPVSPLLQLSYAESLLLFFLAVVLYLLQQRKYFMTIPFIVLMGFTKPGVLALSLTLILLWIYRMHRRSHEIFPTRESVGLIVSAGVAGLTGISWMIISGGVTGIPDAYVQTELVWRSVYVGWEELVPFSPWIQSLLLGSARAGIPAFVGLILFVLVLITALIALLTPAMKKLGIEVRLWLLSFSLYILAVFYPQSSTFRILMPLFPGLGFIAQPQSRLYRFGLVALFILGQWLWLHICWVLHPIDSTPP